MRRIKMLAALAVALLAASGTRGQAPATRPAVPLVMLQITDVHASTPDSVEEFKRVIKFANTVLRPDFTVITGDLTEKGKAEQIEVYVEAVKALQGKVWNLPGNHDFQTDKGEHYRKALGDPYCSFDVGPYHIAAIHSNDADATQLDWARKDLAQAKARGQQSLVVQHHPLTESKINGKELRKVFEEAGVKFLLAGHTHHGGVVNDGRSVQITTTSIKRAYGTDPIGYALVTLDGSRVAWHPVALSQQTVVAISNPISRLMTVGPEGVVRGAIQIRVRAYSSGAIKSVTASIGSGKPMPMTDQGNGLWALSWDSTGVADGEHTLKVEATADEGTAAEQITFYVNQAGTYTPKPASVIHRNPPRKPATKPAQPAANAPAARLPAVPVAAEAR